MNMASLQQLASQIGLHEYINYSSKNVLVRAIQKHKGEDPCFSTDKRYLCKENCEWCSDCRMLRAVWLR